MAPLNLHLTELISQLDSELGDATDLDKISEAQRRAHTLTDLGDQLVGHYVEHARQSGASWTQIGDAIGVSKQAAQQRWVPANFARFTQRARNVVVLAQESARSRGDDHIGTTHLLIGLLGESEGVASHVLIELAGSAQAIISSFSAPADTARKNLRAHLPLSENAKRALGQASEESLALAHNFIGTEHILLGILAAVPPGRAATILSGLGISSAVARRRILHKLGGFTKAD